MHLVSTAGALLSKGVYLGLFSFSVDTTDDFFLKHLQIYRKSCNFAPIFGRIPTVDRQSTDSRTRGHYDVFFFVLQANIIRRSIKKQAGTP